MSATPTWRSPLADAMARFVIFKRLQGYDYSDQARTLGYFDRFLAAEPDAGQGTGLRSDTLVRYVAHTAHLAAFTRQTRLASLREFSRWLHARNPASALLPREILPRHRRGVRFFRLTDAQVAALVRAAPVVLTADPMRARTVGTATGLTYCTGLRCGEALALTPLDIAPDGSCLHVARGKFGKERLVPLSPSAYAALADYLTARRLYATGPDSSALFIDAKGAPLKRSCWYRSFQRLCRHCGIQGKPGPRLHDLRHNYACGCLARWRQAGQDVNAMLPVLATAMGHTNPFATQCYLHLDALALRDAAERFSHYVACHAEPHP